MKIIAKYEEAQKNPDSIKNKELSCTLYWAYRESRDAGADEINLDDLKWEKDVEGIIKDCKEFGIDRITVSSTWSGVMSVLWEFVKRGCTIEGMKEALLDSYDYDWDTHIKTQRTKPAIIIKIN